MTINELVDLLAGHIAAGHGDADVLVSVVSVSDVCGDAVYDAVSRHNWEVTAVVDEAREGFVLLDMRPS